MNFRTALAVAATVALMLPVAAQAQGMDAKVESLKASLAASQAALRHYSWVETTTVTYNGEVKAVKQASVSYGPDGTLQKVPLAATPQAQAPGGLRGRIVAEKKAEMTDYMQSAVALVKTYVPPVPAKLAAVKAAGKVDITMPPGGGATLNFPGYEKPGDNLAITVDPATNRILGINVATYLDDPSQPVTLAVQMGQLADGTTYTATTTLNAPAKNLSVTVANANYQKLH
ncbi:hypothetical protein EUV02_05515 [Polymorphobacter arshaanensis]|uniref:Uncharacterized protein n=1 Tax=Glacieibacterium arshaanense TaxID=2511025 RepID=A0A4Y9ETD1_9SPHN|nr:hypothetical protein [Polymorphobacter arshaanensis]TFU06443.1 hypothetical protein EUV02_05515 [Polymorphobacter arshaanensis]